MAYRYHFDDVIIDLPGFRLFKAGKVVPIEPKALKLLIFLVENRSRMVERRELIDAVWGDAFVTDHVLNYAIGQLRKGLADDFKKPRYIETVPTLGYRFIANVDTEMSDPTDAAPIRAQLEPVLGKEQQTNIPPPSTENQTAAEIAPVLSRRSDWRVAVLLGLALLVTAGVVAFWVESRTGHDPGATPIRSLAVLPLENLSGDASQEYLADGVTDELITGLGQIGSLQIISHTTAMQYKDAHKSLPQIAKELSVDAVVEGSVQRSGNRIRIAVQLVDAQTDKQLWANSYEGDLRDILGLENQVSSGVTEQARVKLTSREQTRLATTHPVDPRAYEALLKGYYFEKFTQGSERKALQYFQQAAVIDPNFARAYVGIARAYNFLAHLQAVPLGEATAASDQAVAKALALDPELGEAYDERAWTLLIFHWDFPGAERDFRRSLELDPSAAESHDGLASYFIVTGRFDEALQELRRARDLDPLSPLILTDGCNELKLARRYDEALVECKAALDLDPNYHWALEITSSVYALRGDHAEEQRINAKMGCDATCLAVWDEIDGVPGKAGTFDAWLKKFKEPPDPFFVFFAYAHLGKKDQAFAWLEKAYEKRSQVDWMLDLGVDPAFDPVRSDPRFDAFLRRVGLPPQADARLAQTR